MNSEFDEYQTSKRIKLLLSATEEILSKYVILKQQIVTLDAIIALKMVIKIIVIYQQKQHCDWMIISIQKHLIQQLFNYYGLVENPF